MSFRNNRVKISVASVHITIYEFQYANKQMQLLTPTDVTILRLKIDATTINGQHSTINGQHIPFDINYAIMNPIWNVRDTFS